ncbi:MAG TPA: hypothetical protein VHG93_28625 [Longimicrobium sp.]|nr:hypothetical protein [Longimicrobium sp.]
MRKLTLALDELQVESFDTDAAPQERGTVGANQYSASIVNPSCCQGTCYDSCGNDCGSWFCETDFDSCGQFSCVWTCESDC